MSHATLLWLDNHRASYGWFAGALVVAALSFVITSLWRDRAADDRGADRWWGLILLALLVAGRWPTFLINREFNPDESQMFAGARALLADPVYWRSVEGGTSGPLNFFILWPAGILLGWGTYLSARLTALGLLALALFLVHQCLARVVGRRAARAATLGAVVLEALTNAVDLLHYSSELLPGAVLGGAAYAAVRRWHDRGGPGWNALGGVLLGAIPLTKLQVVPLAGGFGLAWLVAEFVAPATSSPRHRAYLLGGALLPVFLFSIQVTIAGIWPDVITSYFEFNLGYTGQNALPLGEVFTGAFAKTVEQDGLMQFWLPAVAGTTLLMLPFGRPLDRPARIFTWSALAGCGLAVACVLAAHRPFLHYWQIVIGPATLLWGAVLARLFAPGARTLHRALATGCLLAVTAPLVLHRLRVPNNFVGAFTYLEANPRSELGAMVAAQLRPGDTLAIWGWTAGVFTEANVPQATRDAHFERAVEPGPFREYFRRRFLLDFLQTRPALFLDSAGPASLRYTGPEYAHDRNYPALAAVIRNEYELVDSIREGRLYRRRADAGR